MGFYVGINFFRIRMDDQMLWGWYGEANGRIQGYDIG